MLDRTKVVLATLTTICLLATGCSGSSAPPSAPAINAPRSPTTTPSHVAAATPTPAMTPSATPMAVAPGEPWLVYEWLTPGKDTKDLFLVRPDGSDPHAIATEVPGSHFSASWSPDGRQIAFVVRDDETPEGSIWTMNADGSGAALLSAGGDMCPVGLFHPNWSPDGTKLAVVCYPGGPTESLAIMEVATKAVHRLFSVDHPQAIDNQATWSPDGKWLAFDIIQRESTETFAVGWSVAVVPAAGGKVRRITEADEFLGYPDWSPDGQAILMGSYDIHNVPSTEHPSNLFTIKPDGSGLRQLTHSSVDGTIRIGQARWSSDGRQILVSVGFTDPPNADLSDAQLGFVAAAGGEPVLIAPAIHGSRPDARP